MLPWVACTPAAPSQQTIIIKEMEGMSCRFGFSQTVAMKLVGDQGNDSPWTLASLSDQDITAMCNEWNDSKQGKPILSWLQRTSNSLCCSTGINESSNKRKQSTSRHPKTMDNIVMYLKLMRGMRETPLAHVVRQK